MIRKSVDHKKINRRAEMIERAKQAEMIEPKDRTISDSYAISALKCLQEAINENPHLEWTFNLAPGTQLYVTKDCSDPERTWGPKKGDVLILNQCTGFRDMLGCNNKDGLGATVERNRVRLAKPSDDGYRITIKEWRDLGYGQNDPGEIPFWWLASALVIGMFIGFIGKTPWL